MNYLNSNLAREAGRIHRWREKFWGRRYQAIVVSPEEKAQVGRLRYILSHGCKENLVARPRDWPGANSVRALVEGRSLGGLWIDRTRESRAKARRQVVGAREYESRETVRLVRLPCWGHFSESRYRASVDELVSQIESETIERHSEHNTRPLGVKAVLSQSAMDRPEMPKKEPAPDFHTATKACRREFLEAYRWFAHLYREAARKLRAGGLEVNFPPGSFPPRLPFVGTQPLFSPG